MADLFFRTECARLADLERCRAHEAQRKADAPLMGRVPQKPCDIGLFGDESLQTDLVDLARRSR